MTRPMIGKTEECFADFVERYPQIVVLKAIAAFCLPGNKEALATVQRWQSGDYFPAGEALLRLRCLLYLVGYEVLEFEQLDANSRSLSLMIACGLKSPRELKSALGYATGRVDDMKSVWRILLEGRRPLLEVQTKIKKLLSRTTRRKIAEAEARERERFTMLLQSVGQSDQPAVAASAPQAPADPLLAASFERAVTLTISLGHLVQTSPELRSAVYEATGRGQTLSELVSILQTLSGPDDSTLSA